MTPVRYSPKAARALGFLKRRFNDVEVYVEDSGCRNMWLFVLKKSLPADCKLRSINLLGGRERVLAACRLDQDPKDKRKRIYITDADFDYILGKRRPPLLYYFRMSCYCVENIFFNEATLVEAGLKMMPQADEAQLRTLLNFSNLESEISKLRPLFVAYALARIASERIKTVAHHLSNFYLQSNHNITICRLKVQRHIRYILNEVRLLKGQQWISSKIIILKNRARRLGNEKLISGKDYILPLLIIYLKRSLKYKGDVEQLKVDLASAWQPGGRSALTRALRGLA